MAKTIMVSNETYNELKVMKADKSFSKLILDLIHTKEKKIGDGLRLCLGKLKKDKEFEIIDKALKGGWKGWSRKYV